MSNLKLDSDHDIIIGRGITRIGGMSDEYIIQLVKCRLLFTLGSWELDTNLGIPWLQELLVKNVDNSLFHGILNDAISETPGVLKVDTLSLQRDNVTRKMEVRFRATTINKTTISAEV